MSYYADDLVTVHHGDCLDVLAEMPDASVDSVCTDPPYELAFMSKHWDATGIAFRTEVWANCLRVLKPGGHLLAFGGTRTWHRLTCAIEDAGFEIRDSIAWLYGSGFPKSLDVSKAIDRARDEDRAPVDAIRAWLNDRRIDAGLSHDTVNKHFGHASNGGGSSSSWMTNPTSKALPTWEQWLELKRILSFGDEMDAEVWRLNGRKGKPGDNWDAREVTGQGQSGLTAGSIANFRGAKTFDLTAPATDAARTWQGWGTTLKPAFEPIVVARKPLAGTVAANVQRYGTGALNIGATRVGDPEDKRAAGTRRYISHGKEPGATGGSIVPAPHDGLGRWPPNVLLDQDQADALDRQSGTTRDGSTRIQHGFRAEYVNGTGIDAGLPPAGYGGEGGASRFFPVFRYEPKAPTHERPKVPKAGAGNGRVTGLGGKVRQCNVCQTRAIESGAGEPSCGHGDYRWAEPTTDHQHVAHPTVKPVDLMRWLVRLVTPPGGTVLDPFAGSGTTLEAAIGEGFRCIGIEREADYLPLIMARLSKGIQHSMFAEDGDAS